MIKLLILAGLASLVIRLWTKRWPWEYLSANTSRSQSLAKARKLLGLRNGASHSEIADAHRKLIAQIHPDRGGTNEQVHEANAARDLLLGDQPGDR